MDYSDTCLNRIDLALSKKNALSSTLFTSIDFRNKMLKASNRSSLSII